MVSSLDGKATLDWRTKGLSSDADRLLFHHLRTQADAVMVGAGTAREERYGRMTKNDELRQKRMNEGRVADALAVVVSGRLDLPPDLPLLNDPEQRVVIATASDEEIAGVTGDVEYARTGDDLPSCWAYLHEGARRALRAVARAPHAELPPVAAARRRAVSSPSTRGPGRARARSRSWPGASSWCPRNPSSSSVAEHDGELTRGWRFHQ
jgi:hypothetical protein